MQRKEYVKITWMAMNGVKYNARVPFMLKDEVVHIIYFNHNGVDVRIDGLRYNEHFKRYGGIVSQPALLYHTMD